MIFDKLPTSNLFKYWWCSKSLNRSIRKICKMALASKDTKVWAISDIHVDHNENRRYIQNLDPWKYKEDTLILAGDVTDNVELLEETFRELKSVFNEVCYVPGNHELWVRNKDTVANSQQKFTKILQMCEENNIRTKPYKLTSRNPVWIVPLFSWYSTPNDDGEDSLYIKPNSGTENEDMNNQMWMDNHLCKWPGDLERKSKYFAGLNAQVLKSHYYDAAVISFSHFLPRQDLILASTNDRDMVNRERDLLGMPPLQQPGQGGVPGFNFSRYAGCKILETQIRKLGSLIHVYGHQHRNRDRILEGVRYISHCLGYPREREEGWTWGMATWKGPKQIWPQ